MTFSKSLEITSRAGSRLYQIRASLRKLNLERWITRACLLVASVPKNMVAPKIRSKAATNRRYSLPPFCHSENIEHLCGRLETNGLALLLHSQCCQEYRDKAILAEGQAEIGMAGDLECEVAVPPLVHQDRTGRTPHRQSTEHKGREANPSRCFPASR